jgi:hypothetical protein
MRPIFPNAGICLNIEHVPTARDAQGRSNLLPFDRSQSAISRVEFSKARPRIVASVTPFMHLPSSFGFSNLMLMWNHSSTCSACGAIWRWIARRATSPSVRTIREMFSFILRRRSAKLAELAPSELPLRTKAKRVAFPSPSSTLPATISQLRSGRWCRAVNAGRAFLLYRRGGYRQASRLASVRPCALARSVLIFLDFAQLGRV